MKNLITAIQKEFLEKLQSKNSWGKNEVTSLYITIASEHMANYIIERDALKGPNFAYNYGIPGPYDRTLSDFVSDNNLRPISLLSELIHHFVGDPISTEEIIKSARETYYKVNLPDTGRIQSTGPNKSNRPQSVPDQSGRWESGKYPPGKNPQEIKRPPKWDTTIAEAHIKSLNSKDRVQFVLKHLSGEERVELRKQFVGGSSVFVKLPNDECGAQGDLIAEDTDIVLKLWKDKKSHFYYFECSNGIVVLYSPYTKEYRKLNELDKITKGMPIRNEWELVVGFIPCTVKETKIITAVLSEVGPDSGSFSGSQTETLNNDNPFE